MNYCWILMLLEKASPKGNTCTSYIIDENSRVISTKLVERWNLICACRIMKDKIQNFYLFSFVMVFREFTSLLSLNE